MNPTPPWSFKAYGMKETPEDPLWYWMEERQRIWQARFRGEPKPWSPDPIFQKFKFCNVYRELDRVTCWIRDNIRVPYWDHPNLWFMLAIARTINWPPTLEELIQTPGSWPSHEGFSPQQMTQTLDARSARREQIYTGAYMIRAESDRSKPWFSWTKQRYISEIVLGRLWERKEHFSSHLEAARYLQHAFSWIHKDSSLVGWGPFMTYELVTDLRWTRYLENAMDKNTWANAGPGALRGLQRIRPGNYGQLLGPKVSQREALPAMVDLLLKAKKRLPFGKESLELRDIEHSLCETDKYCRVWFGEGRPRALFNGGR